jgi:hypothetical protein
MGPRQVTDLTLFSFGNEVALCRVQASVNLGCCADDLNNVLSFQVTQEVSFDAGLDFTGSVSACS